ncbi:class I SAM-dependent methyltransferase [Oceanobacillus luteolus]|uniref:Class I SAM-dependent methyltransferase n=1 Tax=Oceanobacillus luteolus TaxID=1274358 RepID=A0ABW4HVD1_9BACI|nr:class I SAM-dependent methyltransferase [Oceanobacillus luteolus]MCM3741056.1 class I SAM-dependent methyltransferase [Oceanobacillus luteolus]
MNEHYFSEKPQTESSPRHLQTKLRDKNYTFTSDTNVFSKGKIDFGSRVLIETFEEPAIDGDFLDLGCGYGPIGISLAGTYPNRHVVLADVNERALSLAEKNANANHVSNVEVIRSDRFSNLEGRKFAAVITNPPIRAGKTVVHGMFEGAKEALVENGELWVVIQKKQGAPSAQKKINELFGNVEVVDKKKGYFILRALKI